MKELLSVEVRPVGLRTSSGRRRKGDASSWLGGLTFVAALASELVVFRRLSRSDQFACSCLQATGAIRLRALLGWVLVGVLLGLTSFSPRLNGQEFFIREVGFSEADGVQLNVDLVPGFYAVLLGADSFEAPFEPVALTLDDRLSVPAQGLVHFYHVQWFSLEEPGDQDGDGIPDPIELLIGLDALSDADAHQDPDGDGADNLEEILKGTDPFVADQVTSITSTSPAAGEPGVAITRETVIRLSDSLAGDGPIDPLAVTASFAGETLGGRVHRSSDGQTLTLFYGELLPPSARVRVTVDGGRLVDFRGQAVDADGDGQPGGSWQFDFDTLGLTSVPGTAVCGRVFASELAMSPDGETGINRPLAGVRISVDGLEDELFALTDQNGNFRLDNAPVGEFFVHVDGRPASVDLPGGAYYPFVGKTWESEPGVEVNVGEIFLPLVQEGTLQAVSSENETVITFAPAVVETFPEFANVALNVPAGALFADSGEEGGRVGIAPVDPARLPGPLPEGLEFPLVITVQTDGATNFDRPVPVCFPNLPDPETGRELLPGESTGLWSFNHDTGAWEVVGSMTANFDGSLVCSDPGSGILAPGWHSVQRGTQGGGGTIVRRGGGGSRSDSEPGYSSWPRNCPDNGGPCPEIEEQDPGVTDTDPVYLFSGELYQEVEDLRIRGRGKDFVWSRKYRSKIGPSTVIGHGWDFSYNIFIRRDGDEIVLADGDSRRDRYPILSNDRFVREEFFREFVEVGPNTFHLIFSDRGRWEFYPFDGSQHGGKIAAIVDRNGNTIRVFYEDDGRLSRIVDTLDREIRIDWNSAGMIASVTDFAGRSVRYEYYRPGEDGGNSGDLKSVTSPAVTETLTGNDFPDGKTVSYTYSTGFEDPRLNHNLLTITDGRRNDPSDPTFGEGPFLRNVFAATTDPNDLNFDRIMGQVWGQGDDWIHFHYSESLPSPANGLSVLRAILNDRNGNVTETFYDRRNRLTRRIEFTGRADPDRVTTPTSNRPGQRLRLSDPAFFVTEYEWNTDSQLKRVVYPNGNEKRLVYESDLNPVADPRARGNLRQVIWNPGRHEPAGDQRQIIQRFEYDTDFNFGCCNFNFVTAHYDGRGNVMRYEYDDRGNRIRVRHRIESIVEDYEFNQFGQLISRTLPDNGSRHRRIDRFTYFEEGHQRGYRLAMVVDAGGLDLTTSYGYDLVGNMILKMDPKGHAMAVTFNELDQVVRKTSREVVDGSGIRYQWDYSYDANNNVVQVDVLNLDHLGVSQANRHFSERYEYEILNQMIRRSREVTDDQEVVTEYRYDANRNRIASIYGEAVNGNQPSNRLDLEYDERDLLFRSTRGRGSSEQSTDEWSYDPNGNLVVRREGIEEMPRVATVTYDGYDRKVAELDPMGNERFLRYDPNHNVIDDLHFGELLDVVAGVGNVRLREVGYEYDALDRRTVIRRQFFDSETQEVIDDGVSEERYVFSDSSQVLSLTNDNGNTTRQTYDTANRKQAVIDAAGNRTQFDYDANSNVVAITEIEKSDLDEPDEVFVTRQFYDNLDRLIRVVDNVGNTTEYAYDSRNNRVFSSDALRGDGSLPGNVQQSHFDGLNRPIQTERVLTDSGRGEGVETGRIVTALRWDDSSRLVARVDDAGNATTFAFDSLDRIVQERLADGTEHHFAYDVHDNILRTEDANGSIRVAQFDFLNRTIEHMITPGVGVSDDVTFERFEFDGRSRLVAAVDDDSRVERSYDSLSNLTREVLNGQTSLMRFDGVRNPVWYRYPSGREIVMTFDPLERRREISDQSGLLANNFYIGPGRLRKRVYGNETVADMGYDQVKRAAVTEHARGIGDQAEVFARRRYAWDEAFNKASVVAEGPEAFETNYLYDSLYRLTEVDEMIDGTRRRDGFELDGVGNRVEATRDGNDLNDLGAYLLDRTAPVPADRQVNQYTATPFGLHRFDLNGNRIETPSITGPVEVRYDYRNRMVGLGAAQYRYDALGRRIERAVDGSTTRYFYSGWQVCEEQDVNGNALATYVYGTYVDDVVQMERADRSFYYHTDDRYNTIAVTDENGSLVEYYRYAAYGQATIRDADGALIAESAVGNPYLFQGRRYDRESGWYYYRNRYLDPQVGRFTTRDPLGIWGGGRNLGNGYTFVGNNPATHLDPSGMDREIVLGPHAYITVDVYRDGVKVGQRDLDFSPETFWGTSTDDWTDKLPRRRSFYHHWVVRIKVPSTMEEDQALLREWRNRKETRWNPIRNCWWATLSSYDVGISRDQNWSGLTDWGSFLVNLGEVDIVRNRNSSSEGSVRPYEPTLTQQIGDTARGISNGIDDGLEYLEENVAQPIVDFFDDPKPALNSLGNSLVELFTWD